MSFATALDAKEQVRQATEIVELVGSYLELRRQGIGYVAICPWHDDTRPSLQVNPNRQSWKCWVCDVGGDVFSFVMRQEGVDFRQALEMLAERSGIELSPQRKSQVAPGSPNDKKTLYAATRWAEEQFHDCLLQAPDAGVARDYLDQRAIESSSIERFRIGFSPGSSHWLQDRARSTGFSPAVLEAAGLTQQYADSGRFRDRFRGRVIFPIRDTMDRPIAFGGRVLPAVAKQIEQSRGNPPPKYVNSPETLLFSKSSQLYGLNIARQIVAKTRHLVVVEGYTDVVIPQQHGVHDIVATLGTALNERHIQLLKRFVDRVTLVYDGDEAGQRRASEILKLFVAAQLDLRILTLPDGFDPCDFVCDEGADAFRQLVEQAPDALEHKVRMAVAGIDLSRETHRATQALEDILATVSEAPRLQGRTTESMRLREQQILARVARQFRLPETEIRSRMRELRLRKTSNVPATAESTEPQRLIEALSARERELFEILLVHPELAADAMQRLDTTLMSSSLVQRLLAIYQEFTRDGELPEFNRVLTVVDDPAIKNLLVELDERGRQKAEYAEEHAADRLNGLIRDYDQTRTTRESRHKLIALEEEQLNAEQELDLLDELIQLQRERQGISAPTDG